MPSLFTLVCPHVGQAILALRKCNAMVKYPLGLAIRPLKSSLTISPAFMSLRFRGRVHWVVLVSAWKKSKHTKSSGSGGYFGSRYSNMPLNKSSIHFLYMRGRLMCTGGGFILNVTTTPQYLLNRSLISFRVSTTSNKSCLKSNSSMLATSSTSSESITLSSLPTLSMSFLLSVSMFSLLSMSLLSVSMPLSSLSLLSISSLLSVSTQPALLAYITLLLLLSNSVSDSCSLSISIPFLTISTSIFGGLLYSTTSDLFDLCLSLICLSRLYFEANLR